MLFFWSRFTLMNAECVQDMVCALAVELEIRNE